MARLDGEHFPEHRKGAGQRLGRELAQASYQTGPIDRADLVEDDMAVLAGESTGQAKGVRVASSRQRGHDEGPEMRVQLIR